MDTTIQPVKLTQYSRGGGCGCKIAPAVLQDILTALPAKKPAAELLVGFDTADDAAVWDLGNGTAIINTVDFFTPIVDDPYNFGRVAATNALSDVYAMGGKPLFANSVLGWPVDRLSPELAGLVLKGASAVCEEAGITIAGGHSIDSAEPFFGLSVNGIVNTSNIKKNSSAKAGDLLFLTKPLGAGVLASAAKKGLLNEEQEQRWIAEMCKRNSIGSLLGEHSWVHSMTDVTGFGLLGHLLEMAKGSRLSAELYFDKIPVLEDAKIFIPQFVFPDNVYRNWNACEKEVEGVSGTSFIVLCDPQTSGGLLISVSPDKIEDLKSILIENQYAEEFLQPIGRFLAVGDKSIKVIE